MNPLDPLKIDLEGYALIEASAGTGKTYTLTTLFMRFLLERGMGSDAILMVTYTRATAEELRFKIRDRLSHALDILRGRTDANSDEQLESMLARLQKQGMKQEQLEGLLEKAFFSSDEIPIFTIHGFCQKMLREFAFESMAPLATDVIQSQDDIILQGCREFARRKLYGRGRAFTEWIWATITTSFNRNLPDALYRQVSTLISSPEPELLHVMPLDDLEKELASFRTDAEKLQKLWKEHGKGIVKLLQDRLNVEIDSFCSSPDNIRHINLCAHPGMDTGRQPDTSGSLPELLRKGLKNQVKNQVNAIKKGLSFHNAGELIPSDIVLPPVLDTSALAAARPPGIIGLLFNRMLSANRGQFIKAFRPLRDCIADLVNAWETRKHHDGIQGPWFCQLLEDDGFREITTFFYLSSDLNSRLKYAVLHEASCIAGEYIRACKKQHGLISYDDMLVMFEHALKRPVMGKRLAARILRRFPVAIIDEFQDTDAVQWEIFSSIYDNPERSRLFLIGDPKQSIYGFRGADIFTYLAARDRVPEERRFYLGTNWRSAPEILKMVNLIFSHDKHKPTFIIPGIEYRSVKPRPSWNTDMIIDGKEVQFRVEVWSECEETHGIGHVEAGNSGIPGPDGMRAPDSLMTPEEITAGEVKNLITLGSAGRLCFHECSLQESGQAGIHALETAKNDRPVMPGDITILVRDFMQAGMIKNALARQGIPCVYHGHSSVFETEEANELLYIMHAASAPADTAAVATALATLTCGMNADRINTLQHDQELWDSMIERFEMLREVWQQQGIAAMIRRFMEDMDVPSRLLRQKEGERRVTNIRQISELLGQAEQEHPGMDRLISWLNARIRRPDSTQDDHQLRLETDENLVQIMTYHRSKGLEFNILFLPFLSGLDAKPREMAVYFDYHRGGYVAKLQGGMPGAADKGEESVTVPCGGTAGAMNRTDDPCYLQNRAELCRIAYVAITRVKHRLYLHLTGHSSALSTVFDNFYKKTGSYDKIRVIPVNIKQQELQEACKAPLSTELQKVARLPLQVSRRPIAPRVWAPISFSALDIAGSVISAGPVKIHGTEEWPDTLPTPGQDALLPPADSASPADKENMEIPKDVFMFPKGPAAGNAMHKIFEICDFRWPRDRVEPEAETILPDFGIDEAWAGIAADIFMNCVNTEIFPGTGLRLSSLEQKWISREMPFSWPFEKESLQQAIKGLNLADHLDKGIMRGFIDLAFRHDEQFYILDYKTNWLGADIDAYKKDKLETAMLEHNYVVQAAIYLRTLHSLLHDSLPDYEPSKHLGGIIYLFVRGLPEAGIFYRSAQKTVQQFLPLFEGVRF